VEGGLASARGGRRDEVGRLLAHFTGYLLAIAHQEVPCELRRRFDAHDLVQETLLNAYAALDHFQGRTEAELLAWLRRILSNQLANAIQHYRGTAKRNLSREVPFPLAPSAALAGALATKDQSPDNAAAAREESESLRCALESLPEQYRLVIQWRNYDRLSFEEVGRRLNRGADAARQLWRRAVACLRQCLEPAR
jgi:RNA polymerase sigma-70 factor (ECF subfamily)